MSVVLYTEYIEKMNTVESLTKQAADKMRSSTGVATLTKTDPGSGYTNGTYTNVPAVNIVGAGTGMLLNLTIAGGVITVAACAFAGAGYVNTDTVKPDESIVGTPLGAAELTISGYDAGTRPVNALLQDICDYKNEIETNIGSGITWSPETAEAYTGETVFTRTEGIGLLQQAMDLFELNIPQDAINNNIVIEDADGYPYSDDMRTARGNTIASFYATYANEYNNLNP